MVSEPTGGRERKKLMKKNDNAERSGTFKGAEVRN